MTSGVRRRWLLTLALVLVLLVPVALEQLVTWSTPLHLRGGNPTDCRQTGLGVMGSGSLNS